MVKKQRVIGLTQPFIDLFPSPIVVTTAPSTADVGFEPGQVWVNTSTNVAYILTSVVAGSATWAVASPGASEVDTLTGDSGGALSPAAGNITIAGGTNITSAGAGSTITLNLDNAIVLSTSVTSPIYTAAAGLAIRSAGAGDITMRMGDAVGANKISFTDSANAEQASLNSDGLLTAANFVGIIGATGAAAGTFTTATATTSVTSPIFTTGAGAGTAIRSAVGQNITIRMGDAAAVNKISFTDSADAEVAALDSNGGLTVVAFTFSGLLTASASATLNTAGTALNLGTDNSGDAVNIGTGNVIRAIGIGNAGAVAHTVAIGSASAGAITVDTAAGISLDSVSASNFTCTTGVLTLQATAASVDVISAEAAADAVLIHASAAGGGVTIRGGTLGVTIASDADCTPISIGDIAPTATRTTTIAGGTVVTAAVTDTLDLAPDGATTNADSVKTVNVNTGGVTTGQVLTNVATGTVTSGTHTTAIASGNRVAGTMALNVMTGTGTKTANLGNADGLTTLNIDAITLINDSINVNTSINTGTSTGAVAIGNALSGAVTIDSVSTVELNSAGAAIGIGNDANAFGINIGTGAAARTITIGNTQATTALVLTAGATGDITVNGTVKEINAEFLAATGDDITFQQAPLIGSALNTGAAATGATGDVNLLMMQDGVIMEQFVLGAGQTIIKPVMDANGLLVSGDLTATEGYEYNFGAARTNSRHAFTIGTSAAFFFECQMTVADVSGANPYMIGFRRSAANNATFESYTDYAMIGLSQPVNEGTVILKTELNSGGTTNTNTTDAWADTGTHTLKVLVSAAGVVTYTIDGLAPTATAAFTFDNADVVCPCIILVHGAVAPGAVNLNSMKIGFQA